MGSNHTTWLWKEGGVVRYVGHGPFREKHPALMLWGNRGTNDSELGIWLQGLPAEPDRTVFGPPITGRREALGFAVGLRKKYAESILCDRSPSSYVGYKGPKRVVFCPDDVLQTKVFDTVRQAARWANLHASTITRRCQKQTKGWSYLDETIN